MSVKENPDRKKKKKKKRDYFAFAEEIVHQDSKLVMGSLDVESLFTNIPLEENINICTNLL